MDQEYIKLIFGLKLKQIRTDRELSLFGLAKISGMSKSYLNEIEKGKKYPKQDKIAILAQCLDVSYDELVSLKLEKNLAPIAKILDSNFLKEKSNESCLNVTLGIFLCQFMANQGGGDGSKTVLHGMSVINGGSLVPSPLYGLVCGG